MQRQKLDDFSLPSGFRGRSPFTVQLWWIVYFFLFRPSPQFLYGWRRFLVRIFGGRIGKKVLLRPTCQITYPWKVVIGDNSWIGDEVVLYSLGEIIIGTNVVVSQRSYICTGTHDYSKSDFPIQKKNIIIENECWLATDVYVAPGVKIGRGSVVGARSSVYKDLPAYMVCFGNPAKVVRER